MNSAQLTVTLTGKEIIDAIEYHLKTEKWFDEIPYGLSVWLNKKISNKTIIIDKSKWNSQLSGTYRLVWLLVASNLEPRDMCRWGKDVDSISAMHRRFTNIIESWSDELKT